MGTAHIKDFIALAEGITGRQLDGLFQRWLYQRGKPRSPGASPAAP